MVLLEHNLGTKMLIEVKEAHLRLYRKPPHSFASPAIQAMVLVRTSQQLDAYPARESTDHIPAPSYVDKAFRRSQPSSF